MRVFVYEYLSGGGRIEGNAEAAETLLPLGLSMRDALMGDLLRSGACDLSVATCDRASAVPEPARAVRARRGESPFEFVARQAAEHDFCWIVAPETGGLLAAMHEVVGEARWLGCSADAIALTASKRATTLRLAQDGIATPIDFEGATDVRRWVVKPDDGAGGMSARVYDRRPAALDDAGRRSHGGAQMIVEPWVEGEALSLSLACAKRGTELLSINRQRIAQAGDGRLSFDGVDVDALPLNDARAATLRTLAERVAKSIGGLRGFVGIDLVWHATHGPVLIEVNPRITCAYVGLSASLGRNLAAELLLARAIGDD